MEYEHTVFVVVAANTRLCVRFFYKRLSVIQYTFQPLGARQRDFTARRQSC